MAGLHLATLHSWCYIIDNILAFHQQGSSSSYIEPGMTYSLRHFEMQPLQACVYFCCQYSDLLQEKIHSAFTNTVVLYMFLLSFHYLWYLSLNVVLYGTCALQD